MRTARGEFTFRKFLDANGSIYTTVENADGRKVSPEDADGPPPGPISDGLAKVLQGAKADDIIAVAIGLREPTNDKPLSETGRVSGASNASSSDGSATINGRVVDQKGLMEAVQARGAALADWQKQKIAARRALVEKLNQRERFGLSQRDVDAEADRYGSFFWRLRAGDIADLIARNSDVISDVDIQAQFQDESLATAMAATSSDLNLWGSQGDGYGVWLTEDGCPPSGFISRYTLVSGTNTDHSRNTTSILRAVSPQAWIYCKGGTAAPDSTEQNGIGGHPEPAIVSVSNGDPLSSGDYDAKDRDWDNYVYNTGLLVVKSAGNKGNSGGITSPGHGLNVLTVGNYNDSTSMIHSSSSGGYDAPNTKNDKPELSAPGTNINAGGFTMTGTSQATPHVAGLLIDETQAAPHLWKNPSISKAHTMAAATDAIGGGFDVVGVGGADYVSGYYSWDDSSWSGSNGDFPIWAANDGGSSNSALEVTFNATAGDNVRVVLTWLTRGFATYANRNLTHPIGADLDLNVSGPGLNCNSFSYDNPFEVCTLAITQTGTYTVRIYRTSNLDYDAAAEIGLSINWP